MKLFVILLAFCAAISCTESAPKDPGARLADQLGMGQTGAAETINKAYGSRSHVPPTSSRQTYETRPEPVQYPKTMGEADKIITELTPKASQSTEIANYLAHAHYFKVIVLRLKSRLIESLVEAVKLRQVCIKFNGCTKNEADTLGQQLEAEINQIGPLALLQATALTTKDQLKQNMRMLLKLLHPDKNFNLDEASRSFLEGYFVRVRKAYEELMENAA